MLSRPGEFIFSGAFIASHLTEMKPLSKCVSIELDRDELAERLIGRFAMSLYRPPSIPLHVVELNSQQSNIIVDGSEDNDDFIFAK